MPCADRATRTWRAVMSDRSADAHLRLHSHLSGAALALLISIAIGTSALVSSRTTALRDEVYPALSDGRQLAALLVATQDALWRDDASGLARADSLAQQFHRAADVAQRRPTARAAALAAASEFDAYYARARRARVAAGGRVTLVDGFADMTFRALRAQLDAMEAAQRRDLDAAYDALQELHVASGIAMALAALAAGALLASLMGATSQVVGAPLEDAARRAQLLAGGDLDVELRTGDVGAEGDLHRALARIARLIRANRTAAEELASGEYRIGMQAEVPEDRTGRALARVSAYLDYLTIAAQRIAEGDLGVVVEPRSERDTLGQAHAMMVRELVSVVRDADATAQLIVTTATEMRRMAAELTLGASAEVSAARRAEEQIASIGSELRQSASRAADLERQALESAATVQEGTAVLHESLDALRQIVRRVGVVDEIAHDANLVALNTGIEVGRAGAYGAGFVAVADEVGSLATQAAEASRDLGELTVRGTESASRSSTVLARLVPAVDRSLALVRGLAAESGRLATELTHARREVGVATDARRRSAITADGLATIADSLVAQAQRLGSMLARLHGATDHAAGEVPSVGARLVLHKTAAERPHGVRKLALV